MSSVTPSSSDGPVIPYASKAMQPYPPGFRAVRGLNWGYLGLLYTSFYLCRFNFSIANKTIADEFKFDYSDMSLILTGWSLAYACGQVINGLLTDKIGGKKAMLIGAAGTITMNILFGAASVFGIFGLFMAIRTIDGYCQSFGAPGMTKIKTAWFTKTERGGFSGIFGFMINLGRLGIFTFGPALLAGFILFGSITFAPLHWKWLFWGPSIVCALVALVMAISIKETPEENGFLPVENYYAPNPTPASIVRTVITFASFVLAFTAIILLRAFGKIGIMDMGLMMVGVIILIFIVLHLLASKNKPNPADMAAAKQHAAETTRGEILQVIKNIMKNPAVWIVAGAYACTGAVRSPVDQWFPRFMQEVHGADMKSASFQFMAFLIPCVASAGSLMSGYVSDKLFKGARAPVAAALYMTEAAIVLIASFVANVGTVQAIVCFVAISFTVNATHSILGTAAAMDIGGRKMVGFAAGIIDAFQYIGASIGYLILGALLDSRFHWNAYFPYMVPFGLIGFLLMVLGRKTIEKHSQS